MRRMLSAENKTGKRKKKQAGAGFYADCASQKKICRAKHDLNNSLQIIYTLMEEDETQKARDFLNEMVCHLPEEI